MDKFTYITTLNGYRIYKCACGAVRKIKVR